MDRDLNFKVIAIVRYTIVGLIVLTFASWILPMYSYSGVHAKEVQETISLWGFIGFTKNYPQVQALLDIKYVQMSTLSVPLIMLVTGVISLVVVSLKKGVATMLLPLIFSAYGLYGYLTSDILKLCNHSSTRAIHIILVALTLVAVLAGIVVNVMEIRSRPADYYLPKLGDF